MVGEEEFGLTASLKPGSNKTKTVIIGMTNLQPGSPIQVSNVTFSSLVTRGCLDLHPHLKESFTCANQTIRK